jgi:hypothetical protein
MKIFLSHSNRDKPLIREVRSYLPQHIRTWIDEEELLFGEDIETSLKKAISLESDFVVIFIGRESVQSEWVKKELRWALKHEKKIGRTFVLPVILDIDAWEQIEPKEFQRRKYLVCNDYSEAGIKALSEKLKDELFAWVSRHLDESKEKPQDKPKIIVETVGLEMGADVFDNLKNQGAPPEAIEKVRDLLGGIPERGLVVRVRNEGAASVLLTGYGIIATQEGKKRFKSYPYAPTVNESPWMDFVPGDYHEFVVDLDKLAHELKNKILQFSGKATIRGFYDGYDGTEYTSEPIVFNLDTFEIEWPKEAE